MNEKLKNKIGYKFQITSLFKCQSIIKRRKKNDKIVFQSMYHDTLINHENFIKILLNIKIYK